MPPDLYRPDLPLDLLHAKGHPIGDRAKGNASLDVRNRCLELPSFNGRPSTDLLDTLVLLSSRRRQTIRKIVNKSFPINGAMCNLSITRCNPDTTTS